MHSFECLITVGNNESSLVSAAFMDASIMSPSDLVMLRYHLMFRAPVTEGIQPGERNVAHLLVDCGSFNFLLYLRIAEVIFHFLL